MSGTAALAAARKRRATPGPTMNGPIKEEVKEVAKPVSTNPALLLLQHNQLIHKLQQEVAELKKGSNDPKMFKDESYKTEYLGLLEEMREMKKVLLKVQTFSMETNLEVMKLKRLSETEQVISNTNLFISPVASVASILDVENVLSNE